MALGLEVLIPFLFVLAVVWGGLDVSRTFKNTAVKAIISLVIAFFAITSAAVIAFINQVLPAAVIFFIMVFFIAFIVKPFAGKGGGGMNFELLIIIIVLALLFLANSTDYLRTIAPGLGSVTQENILAAVAVILVLLIFYAAYKKGILESSK